jgi:hypothetical protein
MADPRDKGFRDYYMNKAADSGYRPNRNRRHPKQPNLLNKIADRAQVIHGLNPLPYVYEKGKEYFPGTLGIAQRGWESARDNWIMHSQNKDYFGGNWLDSKVPNKVKESLMTPRDEDFFDKYMRLAELTTDPDKRKQYIDTANTARQNMQITGRLNYGLSQIDPEGTYLNKKGLPSYSADLFGEGYNRFNLEKFKEAMGMGEGILGGLEALDRHPDALDSYEKETFGIDEKTREQKIQEMHDEEMEKIKNFETDYHSDLLDDMAKDQWPTSGYRFEFDDYVQDRIDALKKKSPEKSEKRIDKTDWGELDDKKEDYIRRQNEYIPPISAELGEPNPQLNFPESEYTGPMPDISIEFGPYDEKQVLPEIKPYNPGWREYGILQNQGLVRGSELRPLEQEYSEYVRWSLAGGQEPVRYEDFLRYSSKPRGPHVGETYRSPSSMRN